MAAKWVQVQDDLDRAKAFVAGVIGWGGVKKKGRKGRCDAGLAEGVR